MLSDRNNRRENEEEASGAEDSETRTPRRRLERIKKMTEAELRRKLVNLYRTYSLELLEICKEIHEAKKEALNDEDERSLALLFQENSKEMAHFQERIRSHALAEDMALMKEMLRAR